MPVIAFGGPAFGLGNLVFGEGLRILITNTTIDDDVVAGAVVGAFSILGNDGSPWTYSLTDDAGGMFAISGSNLVVGATALDHDTAPTPSITVSATDGIRTVNGTFALNVRRPLPALPMATGTKILSLGHSFIQRSAFSNNMGVHSSCVRGAMPWVRLEDHRFNTDMWYDADIAWMASGNRIGGSHSGVGGDHLVAEGSAPGTIERTPWVVARNPGIVYLDIGTNDISSGSGVTSAEQVIERLDRQLTLLRNAGIWVVIQTITDRGAWPEGDEHQTMVAETNVWIKAQAGRSGVRVCDITGIGFNYPLFDTSLFGADVLHPNPKGGKAIKGVLLPILQEMVSPGETWNLDPADGNIWPSHGLLGTTGTISATYGSGQVATGHRVTRNSGSAVSAVCSKEVIDATYEKQVITFTSLGGGARDENWRFVYGSSATLLTTLGLVEGDWFEMLMFVEFSASPLWNSIVLQAELYQSTTLRISSGTGFINPDDGTQDLPLSEGWSGWLRMMPTLVQGSVDRFRLDSRPLSLDLNATAVGTGVLKISKPIIRKISDPRVAWNLPV